MIDHGQKGVSGVFFANEDNPLTDGPRRESGQEV
jgi:hypothetical protein